ncbi:TlpA family protein disulfide reductase [Streptomyces zingiberis]|uniref:TlpA family protein disulfide reductase n=1 Tax=Streptomyces zingiberis TaxID=2053010 RepID=A0ABX1C7D6_9ACTN|nr:TlpA disulfide reductase family protein [Streptomyces zingiberis]NJQ03772.1 TlpA family protein disulfide reductase [Streptomyces zingiberis]
MSGCDTRRDRAPRRRATALTAAVAAGLVLLSGCGGGESTGGSGNTGFVAGDGGVDRAAKGDRRPAPDLSGETVDGERAALADYAGKVVVVNVWGSWCAPCRAEMPHLVKVADDTRDRGVEFLGINTRDPNITPARKFEKEFEVPYPSLYDPAGKLMLRFPKGSLNPKAIPSTLVIDRDGKIAARALKPLGEDELREMIEPLIAEK